MVNLKFVRFYKTIKNNNKKRFFLMRIKNKQNNKTIKKKFIPLLTKLVRKNNDNNKTNKKYLTQKKIITMPKFNQIFTIKKRLNLHEETGKISQYRNVNKNRNAKNNADSDTENNTDSINIITINDIKKQFLFEQYIRNKALKHKKMQSLNQSNTYNKNKTPIYNSYVPGSGVGALNIATRRLKKKLSYLP